VISLPTALMLPRLESLIPNLMVWSHEHKAHFKAKVKHILERMIRRFGADVVMRYCPDEDRKLVANIRKTKERAKRHKEAAKAEGVSDDEKPLRKGRFESEYDEALHGSDSDGSDVSDDEVLGKSGRRAERGGKSYIVEDEEEPLDLLDRRALANISSTKPLRQRVVGKTTKAKMDVDGKLILGEDSDEDKMVVDAADGNGNEGDEGGIGAYVNAIKGRDAAQRGRGGKLKFSNRREKEEVEEMEVDEEEIQMVKKQIGGERRDGRGRGRGGRGGRGGSGRGGFPERRSLGREKQGGTSGGGGRVMKSPRGRERGGRGGRR